MSSIDDFPRSVTILTSLEMPVAADRLRAMVHDRPAIEDQRHWLSERCVSGRVDGTDVRADVRYRYIGRWYAPNSWTVGFKGKLVDDEGRASLHGEVKYDGEAAAAVDADLLEGELRSLLGAKDSSD